MQGHDDDSETSRTEKLPDILEITTREAFGTNPTRSTAAPPPLAPNTLLAGRYGILRFIAQGGMGQVYEAQDRELRETVAVKTILPAIAQDGRSLDRFKREIQLSRKVTHPNVCRIFDLGFHQPDGGGAALVFLTMEMLPGETLSARLRRDGPLATGEAIPILRQIGAALAAAHRAGIVHRDFKSENVILVPHGDGIRAVVTDFGLARGGLSSEGDVSLTDGGFILGTLAYMAPEQVEGGKISPATDIYALGVVLFEMLTGRKPFIGETALSAVVKRLKERAPSPRLYLPDIDPKWEAAILRCLERAPGDRFSDAEDVVRAIAGEEVASGHASRRFRFRLGAGAAIGLALAALLAWLVPVARRAHSARRGVAVLGFRNLSARTESSWISTALSEMLATELSAGERLRVVPGENVARMKVELGLPESDLLALDTLARIHSHLAADVVVAGSYLALGQESGGQLRLDLHVQETSGGRSFTLTETGTESRLIELVSHAGSDLRGRLGLQQITPAQAEGIRATLPSSAEGARLYAEGLGRLRLFDAIGARDWLSRSAAADPGSPLVHAALSEAWSALGYDARARGEARQAYELSRGLSREERLSVEGRFREAEGEWPRAIEIRRTLYGFFPDNLEYGLALASSQTSAGRGTDALSTIASLRKLPAPESDDPRIDLEESRAAQALADARRANDAADRAARKGRRMGARLIVARAQLQAGIARRRLGDFDGAIAADEAASRVFTQVGDRRGVARAQAAIGNVQYDRGNLAEARKVNEQALAAFRQIGDVRGAAAALKTIGGILEDLGDGAGARAAFAESLRLTRESGDRAGEGSALLNMGNVIGDQGDFVQARSLYEQALAIFREVGERGAAARALNNLADIQFHTGDLEGARKLYQESLEMERRIGDRLGAAQALNNVGSVASEQGRLADALKSFEEAARMDRSLGDKPGFVLVKINTGEIRLEQGDFAGAEQAFTDGLTVARQLGNDSFRAYAVSGLGEAARERGDFLNARQMYAEALATREKLKEAESATLSRLDLADLDLDEGRPADAAAGAARAAAESHEQKSAQHEARALALKAQALLRMGHFAEAAAAVESARPLVPPGSNAVVRLRVLMTEGEVLGNRGKSDEGRRQIAAAVDEASRLGIVTAAFDARLALARLDLKTVSSVQARTRLSALSRDATERGFGRVARAAAAIAAGG